MFSKPDKTPARPALGPATGAKHIPFSLVGADVSITGDLQAAVDLHIDGRIDGNIVCAALVQGPESRITGHVTAKSARIAGQIEGSLSAEELIVEASARITGDVAYATISIAAGAQVAGQFTHQGSAGTDLKLVASDGASVS